MFGCSCTLQVLQKGSKKYDILVSLRPLLTIQQFLMNPQDRIHNLEQTGVVQGVSKKR